MGEMAVRSESSRSVSGSKSLFAAAARVESDRRAAVGAATERFAAGATRRAGAAIVAGATADMAKADMANDDDGTTRRRRRSMPRGGAPGEHFKSARLVAHPRRDGRWRAREDVSEGGINP